MIILEFSCKYISKNKGEKLKLFETVNKQSGIDPKIFGEKCHHKLSCKFSLCLEKVLFLIKTTDKMFDWLFF